MTILLGTTALLRSIPGLERPVPRRAQAGALQSNIEQRHKIERRSLEDRSPSSPELIEQAIARRELPDLIVWPETAYPYGFIAVDSEVDPAALERQVRSIRTQDRGREMARAERS